MNGRPDWVPLSLFFLVTTWWMNRPKYKCKKCKDRGWYWTPFGASMDGRGCWARREQKLCDCYKPTKDVQNG